MCHCATCFIHFVSFNPPHKQAKEGVLISVLQIEEFRLTIGLNSIMFSQRLGFKLVSV